jgi:ATP-dependent Lon protease
MPSNVRQIANKELEMLSGIITEYKTGINYIDYLIDLPWNIKTEDNPDLSRVERVLNERHYGQHKIKEIILEHLAVNIFMANRILVVDDEKIALRKLDQTLKKEGYSVVTANNGEEAFRKLESSDFDLVITDLKMDKIDGIDVLEKTKSKYPDALVIMMTGYSDVETAVDAMRKGAFNYIEKPLSLETVRTVVRQALENKLTTRTKKAPVLCFAGPPGTGKTSLGRAVAGALGRKFARISMDKIKDEAEIRGHRRTFAGAMPGRIIEKICLAGSANPVLMLVGLDRIGDDFKGDPASALRAALDPERNHNFIDNYILMPFDLSSVMFIVTADIADNILSPLSDLIEVIEFSGYTEIEKIEIALKYLVPRQIYEKGLSGYPPEFTPEAISLIIKGYTREAGVRELQRQIAAVCRKIDAEIAYGDEIFQIIKLEPGLVEGYLGPRMY